MLTGSADDAFLLDAHLLECRRPRGPADECNWCHWALTATPALRTLVDVHHDALVLREVAPGHVPWVVAATGILATASAVDLAEIAVPSVAARAERVRASIAPTLAFLDTRLTAAVAAGGPVEASCLATAGLLAATAVQRPEHAAVLARFPPDVRAALAEASRLLSADLQVAALLPIVAARHEHALPELRTQMAWTRRPAMGTTGRGEGIALEPGSLEAIVVEAVVERVIGLVDGVAAGLLAGPRIRLTRPAGIEPLSERTRRALWRIARIDWHLTFVDTGRADCWDARIEAGHVVTDVPFTVALAIAAGRHAGLVSATHPDRPDGVP